MSEAARPTKVAVIGGGCAALTAAYELSRPEHGGRYEVTVYQQGWRLGGKGASGRGRSGRIEEHGLHLWMGWYENAFRLMRDCYAELGRDPDACPIATWRDAFAPDAHLGVVERVRGGEWIFWTAHLPAAPGLPGDPYPEGHRWSVAYYLMRSAALVRTLLSTLGARAEGGADSPSDGDEGGPSDPILRWISRLSTYGGLASLALLAQAASALELGLRSLAPDSRNSLLRLVEAIASNAREQIEDLVNRDPHAGRLWTIVDLTLASMRGIIRFGLLDDERGFDAIDDYDCREWLLLNGASRRSVDSGFVNGLYDLGFSYEDGDPARPRIAAGQSLRATIRAFFTYRRSFFWRMQAGMGDVVFAPLYEVMKRRGVRFEFFHRLEKVGLSSAGGSDSPHVATLEFDVQARIAGGGEYRPLVDVKGLPCWPSDPDWAQLDYGEWLEREGRRFESFWEPPGPDRKTLRVGDDFDLVVLGVGAGAIPHVCRELVESDPRWRSMVEHVKTVATQAFQVWLHPSMEELGWMEGPVSVSGFVEPFDTWADMRHLIKMEDWAREPGSLAYFCSVLPDIGAADDRGDDTYPLRQAELVRANAVRFLDRDVRHLWPRALRAPGIFRWEALVDPERPDGEADDGERCEKRFDTQYWTANVNPSDRYALSLPGSLVHRISPLDDSYDNLTVCGDWTACGFSAGCVEAAVMSGLLAAHAISLSPPLEEIVGYDHP